MEVFFCVGIGFINLDVKCGVERGTGFLAESLMGYQSAAALNDEINTGFTCRLPATMT